MFFWLLELPLPRNTHTPHPYRSSPFFPFARNLGLRSATGIALVLNRWKKQRNLPLHGSRPLLTPGGTLMSSCPGQRRHKPSIPPPRPLLHGLHSPLPWISCPQVWCSCCWPLSSRGRCVQPAAPGPSSHWALQRNWGRRGPIYTRPSPHTLPFFLSTVEMMWHTFFKI